MEIIPLLKQLTEVAGPSGREEPVCALLQSLWRPLVDELRTDALGNLIALQRGSGPEPRPALLLAAHMDEIGLLVTGIERGFLRVAPIGGADRRVLPGLEVIVHGRRALPGVIGARPPHVLRQSARRRLIPWDKLWVDVGLPPEEVAALVQVGDPVSWHCPLVELQHGLVAGKALDNRASVAALTLTLEALSRQAHAWDVWAVATVREEVGHHGADTAAYGIAPRLAVALDVTFARQADDSGPGAFELGEGPALGVGPNFHPAVVRRLRQTAEQLEMTLPTEPLPGPSGTDAWGIQVARAGIPTALLSIPLRYMHQPLEVVALRDVARTARLLAAWVADLEADYRPRWEDEVC